MRVFGLIGRHIGHSFSPAFFKEKFEREGILDAAYRLFPLETIASFDRLEVAKNEKICGLNVTIPYKLEIIPYLDVLSEAAKMIGAVNTIAFKDGQKIGHNTDAAGFEKSLLETVKRSGNALPQNALILGTGGASKAVRFILEKHNIHYKYVSRNSIENGYTYDMLSPDIIKASHLIINTTPLGMFPNITSYPVLSYEAITAKHLCIDLVYNPVETTFLKKCKQQGATTENGLAMLHGQAEKAWSIWNSI